MDQILRLIVNCLIAGGAVGLIAAAYYAWRGKPYLRQRDPGRLAIASLIAAAIGIVGYVAMWAATPAASAPPIVTETRFESSSFPALAIDAPPGWWIEYNTAQSMVMIRKGEAPIAVAPAGLNIESSLLQNDAVLDRLIAEVGSAFEANGAKVEPPFVDSIGGLEAQRIIVRVDGGEVCSWVVKRGRRFVSSVQCFSRDGTTCRTACAPALERLRWTTPRGVATTAL